MGNVHRFARPPVDALDEERPAPVLAAATSIALSVLFLVVYSGCNWLTARRHDVGFVNFEWERHLPFVPLLIVPYMSIDLFFLGAPFLFQTRSDLSIFARRVTLAIVAAGICFLLFPFQFAFARPHTGGWTGALFDWFRAMDGPYNLFPSLHITLCLLLAEAYARHTRGIVRAASMVWFGLIGLSAVLTYQHHVLDVVGGLALAGYCFYFLRRSPARLPVITNSRIGMYYLAGTVVTAILAVFLWPSGGILLWPAIAMAIIASAYYNDGPAIFRKTDGRLPISARFVLGPVLIGQRLSLWYYRRQCHAWDQVTERVWIGGVITDREAAKAVAAGVSAVLDLTAEFSENKPFRSVGYRNIAVLDLTPPTFDQLNEISDFIDQHSREGVVYVHCKIGYSRSAAGVGAWLLKTGRAHSVDDALVVMRRVRPSIVIRPEVIGALHDFSARLKSPVGL